MGADGTTASGRLEGQVAIVTGGAAAGAGAGGNAPGRRLCLLQRL